jgi:hypothetical protein
MDGQAQGNTGPYRHERLAGHVLFTSVRLDSSRDVWRQVSEHSLASTRSRLDELERHRQPGRCTIQDHDDLGPVPDGGEGRLDGSLGRPPLIGRV